MLAVMCFNPCRVFSSVAIQGPTSECVRHYGVSIPVGFSAQLRLNTWYMGTLVYNGFQSLSGFQLSCDIFRGRGKRLSRRFQSLSGFQLSCDSEVLIWAYAHFFCFNPCRVFSSVAITSELTENFIGDRFQSLSGFQLSCDMVMNGHLYRCAIVSIPVGFSAQLRYILVS